MHRTIRRASGAALLLLALSAPAAAQAAPDGPDWYADPDVNATWTQSYITEADGTVLHADVLRPKGLAADAKTPVILSAGPYFGHAGEVGPAGPIEGTGYDPANTAAGPSLRFRDFVVGAKLMQKGYTFIMVDLRGFGGSTGCLDWGGPGEQADVKAAVEWAASQPFSNGKVGMYGKSYDGVTGLMGIAQQPKGLAAVVAQEPVFDLYRYLYSNGVRFENSLATPALYDAIAASPGVVGGDDADYIVGSVNDTSTPGCPAVNYASQAANSNHASDYWKFRDLIAKTKGKATPTFLTQGFLENNTKPDGAWDFYNGLTGPKRGWFGMWDHIRGNDTIDGKNDYQPWFDETMRFFDQYLDGKAPAVKDPNVYVQTNDGTWRGESAWPPADSVSYTTALKTGSYTDDSMTAGSNEGGINPLATAGAEGVWTFSPPLASEQQFAGVPQIKLQLAPLVGLNTNVAADVYDVDAAGKATLLSRTAAIIPADGKLDLEMYGNDWTIAAGHRIGVLVTDANAEWYLPVPTGDQVTVESASITLPFLKYTRPAGFKGKDAQRRLDWLEAAPFTIPAATITAGTAPAFAVPPARTASPAGTNPDGTAPGTETSGGVATTPATTPGAGTTPIGTGTTTKPVAPAAAARLTARLAVPRGKGARRIHVTGRAPKGASVLVRLVRNGKVVVSRRVKATAAGRYGLDFVVRRAGTYTARVSTRATGTALRTTARKVAVHLKK